jgi:uncharacterized protein
MTEFVDLVARYVAVWNEFDPSRRHERVADLWDETAVRYNHTTRQAGRREIENAVNATYEHFGANGFRFRPIANAVGHHDALKFSWQMYASDTGEVDSLGTTFLLLNADEKILLDYQFTEHMPPPETRAHDRQQP